MLVFEISSDDFTLLGPHRTRTGWEICGEASDGGEKGPGWLWLRCPEGEAEQELIAGLPCAGRYRADAGSENLVPFGKTLPVGRMPAGPWVKLADWLQAGGPQAMLPGRCQDRMAVELSRSGREEAAAALILSLEALTEWAESASRLRLARLRFAVSGSGGKPETARAPMPGMEKVENLPRVLVIGEPPPAAPGLSCYARGALLLPCGWDFAPPLRAEWVEESLALPPGAVALFDSTGHADLLEQESFAPLSLAALRRTRRALGLGS